MCLCIVAARFDALASTASLLQAKLILSLVLPPLEDYGWDCFGAELAMSINASKHRRNTRNRTKEKSCSIELKIEEWRSTQEKGALPLPYAF